MSEENNRVYIDTNVLYNWLFSNDPADSTSATKFMSDVEDGKYVGIISDFTLSELRKVIRNQLVRKGIEDPAVWSRKEQEAITRIYQIEEENVEVVSGEMPHDGIKNDEPFSRVSGRAYVLMGKYPGKAIAVHRTKKHKGLSTADTIHVVLAQNFGCGKIASFDRDFGGLSEIPQLDVRQEYAS